MTIYALRRAKRKALSALRRAIDDGWRCAWRYFLEHDLVLESPHDAPELPAVAAEINADMAAQLARVRETKRRGELVFPTEQDAPTP